LGGLPVSRSLIHVTAIIFEHLRKIGYEAMLTNNEKIAPHPNESLYTRTVATAVGEPRPTSLYWCGGLFDYSQVPFSVV